MYQQAAWLITLILSAFVIFIFVLVLKRSGQRVEYSKVQAKGYFLRNIWFVILLVGLSVATYFTLDDLPFERATGKGTPMDTYVEAVQFGFNVSEQEFQVGDYVAFHVTSSDVNHGFGLYDEDMNIVAQTQAMPEYTNTVYHQFEKPGTYTILCLEYCGLAHHLMSQEITVTE